MVSLVFYCADASHILKTEDLVQGLEEEKEKSTLGEGKEGTVGKEARRSNRARCRMLSADVRPRGSHPSSDLASGRSLGLFSPTLPQLKDEHRVASLACPEN